MRGCETLLSNKAAERMLARRVGEGFGLFMAFSPFQWAVLASIAHLCRSASA